MASQVTSHQPPQTQRLECFKFRDDPVTTVALAVLGACLLAVGLYLMFSGIGTIPASMVGFTLTLAGTAGVVASIVSIIKS